MNKNIIFLGMGLDSPNRGVNALCIGAAEVVKNVNLNLKELHLITFRKSKIDDETYCIATSSGELTIIAHYFTKKELLLAIKEIFLLKLFNKNITSKLLNLIKASDKIYDLNEGDSFSDIYGFKRILRHFLDSYIALSFNKDIVFLPQTIGPFDTIIGKKMGLYILKKIKKLYVRDNKAIKFLKNYNIDYEQTIDLAVYMKPKELKIKLPDNFVAININGLMYFNNYSSLKGQFEVYKSILLKLIDFFQSINKNILFIPHTYTTTKDIEEDDLKAIENFISINSLDNCQYVDKEYDVQELKYIISKSEFFIGSRMHACIGGLSTSVPTIGLAYSYKFKGTFTMFGSEDTVFEINNLKEEEIDKLVSSIKNIYYNKSEYVNKLKISNKREMLII